jgi:hypothetical protein
MGWLSINFCDLCTHTRIDVGIATSDSMALRDVPHDSSVTTRKTQNPRYITLSCLESHNLPANEFRCACAFISWARYKGQALRRLSLAFMFRMYRDV